MIKLSIEIDDPTVPDVRDLLQLHMAHAQRLSAPDHVFALDVERLLDPNITFYSARTNGVLIGVGALRELDRTSGEVKSMHTAEEARGSGVGRAMIEHIIGEARERGYRTLALETGAGDPFAPARSLYASVGFQQCAPFGDYVGKPHSFCMAIELLPVSNW